jgi:SAM-dependent methyltransferase
LGEVTSLWYHGNRFGRRFVLVFATYFFSDFGFAGLGLFLNLEPPSAWVKRWAHLLPLSEALNGNDSANLADVLDLACGHGRHMQFLSNLGRLIQRVVAIRLPSDLEPAALSRILVSP